MYEKDKYIVLTKDQQVRCDKRQQVQSYPKQHDYYHGQKETQHQYI